MRATYDNPGRVVKIGLTAFIAQMVFSFLSPFIPVVRDLSFLPMPMAYLYSILTGLVSSLSYIAIFSGVICYAVRLAFERK